MTKHTHAEFIKAWADGAEIQYRYSLQENWKDVSASPLWNALEYRIKPKPKKDVEVLYAAGEIIFSRAPSCLWPASLKPYPEPNLKLIYDGETGKLKKAELI